MQAIKANITKALQVGTYIETCDNSGAKLIQVIAVKGYKTRKGRRAQCGVGDLIMAHVVKGKTDMRKKVVFAVVVRQRKEYRRPNGVHIKFEDNSAVVLKDDKGNPQGTLFKGPIAKEACERWPGISKVSSMIV